MKLFFYLMLRYTAAIFVAFIASTMILWALAMAIQMTKHFAGGFGFTFVLVSMSIVFAISGFSGVYSGARCLPLANRRSGAVLLTLLGLCFAACMAAILLVIMQPKSYWEFFTMLPVIWMMSTLAIGAAGAILLVRKQWPGEAGRRTDGPPVKGKTNEAENLPQA